VKSGVSKGELRKESKALDGLNKEDDGSLVFGVVMCDGSDWRGGAEDQIGQCHFASSAWVSMPPPNMRGKKKKRKEKGI